jgi:hypothetical protein
MTICLPVAEVISIDAMASVDTVLWRCRLCDHHGTATTTALRPPDPQRTPRASST